MYMRVIKIPVYIFPVHLVRCHTALQDSLKCLQFEQGHPQQSPVGKIF